MTEHDAPVALRRRRRRVRTADAHGSTGRRGRTADRRGRTADQRGPSGAATSPCAPGRGEGDAPACDGGSVTAELAVGLPAVVLLLVVVLAVVGAGLTRAQCLDGARAGARALALGESPADAASTARRVAGAGARVRTAVEGEWVTVVVEAPVPLGGLRLGSLTARGTATARAEP